MITRQFERAFFSLHEGQGTNNEDSEFDSEGLRYSTFSFLSLLSSQMIVQHFIEGLSNFGKCLRLSNSKPKILTVLCEDVEAAKGHRVLLRNDRKYDKL